MDLARQRPTLLKWADRKGVEGIAEYQAERKRLSVDGLPGLTDPRVTER